VQPETLASRRRLYLLARVLVSRHYRSRLTLAAVARALSSSPRQIQRAYAQFGELSFHEDLHARRLSVAAQLLAEQPTIAVRDVARLVGYSQAPHFAAVFRRRYGIAPARFREQARAHRRRALRAAIDRGAAEAQTAVRAGASATPASSRETSSTTAGSIASAPGRRMRISVPPPGAASART
jgi:AraC-like DNA-binding protein